MFALVFGMSATVKIENLKEQLQNKKAIIVGVLCQFLMLPLLGFLSVKLFVGGFDSSVGIALLVATSSPGGAYSNWWTNIFNGDLALSITMTACSTILSIAMLPINLLVYTSLSYDSDVVDNLDWFALFLSLFVVISAIMLGIFSSYKLNNDKLRRWANLLGNVAGVGLMIFSATVANNGESADSKVWSRSWQFYIGVGLPCVLGLVLTNVMAAATKLKPVERVTVAIECCYQNVGIATSLSLTMFTGPELNAAMGVPVFYAITEIVLISIFCLGAWKRGWTKAPPTDSLCKILCTSYEVAAKDTSGETRSDDTSKSCDDVTKSWSDIGTEVETEITVHTVADDEGDDEEEDCDCATPVKASV